MGNGSEVACGAVGLSAGLAVEAKLTVTSMVSVSWTVASCGSSEGEGGGNSTSGAGTSMVVGAAGSSGPSKSSRFCHSSGSSTSASRSAPARQLGQMKMGYCGEVSKARTHLKCHVWEQGATKSDWQGCWRG